MFTADPDSVTMSDVIATSCVVPLAYVTFIFPPLNVNVSPWLKFTSVGAVIAIFVTLSITVYVNVPV